jgi:hypothetical protein
MERTKQYTIQVRYLGSKGPAVLSIKIDAVSTYHAIELAITKARHIQPNRAMYEVLPKAMDKKKQQALRMKREQQILAGFAECYAWTYQ